MKDKKRIPTSGEPPAWSSPFAALKDMNIKPSAALPAPTEATATPENAPPKKDRGRVDIVRQTAHRGGKTVTVVTNFPSISPAEKEKLAKEMQKTCGAGGTIKEGRIEIQGDHREKVALILKKAGFRPVLAGG